jgi:electron transport complex protein RnfG
MSKMIVVTTIICAFSAAWLGMLNKGLKARIIQQEDFFIRGPAIMQLLDGCPNNPLADRLTLDNEGSPVNIYPWIEEGKVRRVALERPGRGGYAGDVIVMTALDMEADRVYGVAVTQHKETPGVGTRAMEPSYLKKFVKLSVGDEIKLKKDGGQIDAVSGATRSSIAIADGVNQAAKLVEEKKEAIIDLALKN